MKWVINTPYQITGSGETNIHLCLFQDDFRPAAGTQVKVNGQPVGTVDETGTCIFRYTPGNGQSHSVEAGEARFSFACNARTESFRSDHLFVYTDRGVYNPGQNILVRLLAWELLGEYQALANRTVELLLQREGKLYYGTEVATNQRGVAWAEIPLAETLPEGTYELKVSYAGASESARLQVRRFQPPAIEIEHNLPRFLTPRQERLDFQVRLRYPTGGEPAESTLRLQLSGPGGRVLRSQEWCGEAAYQLALEDLKLDLKDGQGLEFKLEAEDAFGQRGELKRDARFSNRPYTAALETDKDAYPGGEEVELKVKLVDLDGRPATAVELLCQSQTARSDELGVATFRFPMPDSSLTVTVSVPALGIEVGSRSIHFVEQKPLVSKVLGDPRRGKVRLRANFENGFQPVESVVHVDFTDLSGGLVTSAVIPVKDGVAEGEVYTESWGTMLVNLYCLAAPAQEQPPWDSRKVGFVTEGQQVTVYPDRELTVELRGWTGVARPGSQLGFEVHGERPAALGAALVDRSVISLMDPLEKTPLEHFYQAQRKAISTGGSAVMTWPRVDRNWGLECHDIAYCNWGFKQPDPPGGGGPGPEPDTFGGPTLELDMALDYGSAAACEAPAPPGYAPAAMAPPCPEPSALTAPVLAALEAESMAFACKQSYEPPPAMDAFAAAPMAAAFAPPPPPPPPRASTPPPRPTPQITVRTQQPDTAWWEPDLDLTEAGLALELPVPDLVGSQQLTLVASDENGRVGLLRQDLSVTQELWSRLTVPGQAVAGDVLEVQALVGNGTEAELAVEVSAEGGPAVPLRLPPLGTDLAIFMLECPRPGPRKFSVLSRSHDLEDLCHSRTWVKPAGFPVETTGQGQALELMVQPGASHSTLVASLRVDHPVIQALQGWELSRDFPWALLGAGGFAGRLLLEIALYEWCRGQRFSDRVLLDCQRRIARLTAELVAAQQPDGGWGSASTTTRVLEALLEGRRAGLKWTGERIDLAVRFLLNQTVSEALWPRVFAVVARAGKATPDWNELARRRLAEAQDPWTLALLMQGLGQRDLDRLLSLRQHGYWEPHWDSAYGGTVEVNAMLLELLLESGGPASAVHEVCRYLLSTRPAWGKWHNELGTVAAVRALLKVAPERSWKEGEVVLRLNDNEVLRLKLEGDPFVAAARLGHLDLSQHLREGPIRLEVEGAELSVSLCQWGLGAPLQQLTVARSCAGHARLGEPLEVRLHLATPRPLPWSRLEDALPAHVAPDLASLEELVKSGLIEGFAITPSGVALELGGWEGQRELVYRVRPVRTGRSGHSGCRLVSDEDWVGYAVSQPLEVTSALVPMT